MWKQVRFSTSVMWRNLSFLHMMDVEQFSISPHDRCGEIRNFSTWQIFLHRYHLWYLWQISAMCWLAGLDNCRKEVKWIVHINIAVKLTAISLAVNRSKADHLQSSSDKDDQSETHFQITVDNIYLILERNWILFRFAADIENELRGSRQIVVFCL